MFQAMKLFALLAGEGGEKAFAAATVGGAQALGLGDDIGRIAPGRKADITLLSLRDPAFAPLNDAVRQLVYTEPGRSVRHVIVDGRVVIDNGRATMLDEDALYEALQSDHLRGAALDVYVGEFEHLPDPRLWQDPRVLLTPHISGGSDASIHGGIDLFCDNLRAYLAGKPLQNVIDWQRGY